MTCSRCGEPIGMSYIGDAGGPSHPRCYHAANPYRPKATLAEVLSNGDDMVLARRLVERLCPPLIASEIVAEFNRIMAARAELDAEGRKE